MEQAVTSDTGPGSGARLELNRPETGRVEGSLGGSGGGCSVTFINQDMMDMVTRSWVSLGCHVCYG